MTRGQYVVRRVLQMFPVLLGITLIVFLMLQLIPGDPVLVMLGPRANPESIAGMRRELGLDKPIWQQYALYLQNLATLDLGRSLKYRVGVRELIGERMQVTVFLVTYASALTALISLPLGILAALKKDSIFDQIVRILLMVTLVMPAFWVGILFLMLFSVRLGILPVSGYGETFTDHLVHLFLPSLTVALSLSPILVRSLRASILEAMGADYVKAARAKGLAEQAIVFRHVLRNALIPTVTLFGLSVGYLIGGTVIVEKVFSLPGAGALLVDSIGARDYPVVQSTTLIFAFLIILVNLLTDLTYTLLDPRVKLG